MSSAKADCRQCDGTGELYVSRINDNDEPEESFNVCPCVIKVNIEKENNNE